MMANNGAAITGSGDEEDKNGTTKNITQDEGPVSSDRDDQHKKESGGANTVVNTTQLPRDVEINNCRPEGLVVSGIDSLPHINGKNESETGESTGSQSQALPAPCRSSSPNIGCVQSKKEKKASGSHSGLGNGMHLNGFVSVCTHNSVVLSSPTNLHTSSRLVSISGQVVHVNGNGTLCHDVSTDDNFDQVVPNGQFLNQSEHSEKGARPKKLKKRSRRDDRQSKPGFCLLQSDSEDEDISFQSWVSDTVSNAARRCQLSGEIRKVHRCSAELPHCHLQVSPQCGPGHHTHNRIDQLAAVVLPLSPQRDEDLVDEGAVCDYDRNVLAEENLFYTEDTSVSSPVDGGDEVPNFSNGHNSYDCGHPLLHYPREEGHNYSPRHNRFDLSDSEEDAYRRIQGGAAGAVGQNNVNNAEDDIEDNGDFIDADLPVMSGPMMSSSADSASLSSVNGDLADPGPELVVAGRERVSFRQENDLSGGSDKELNHKQNSPPDVRTLSDSALFRASYSSPSHDGGFDNFQIPRDLSSSDGVFWNSSESENEDELSEGVRQERQNSSDSTGPVLDGAGVAEASFSSPLNEEQVGEQHFGAGGDFVSFYFDRACCLQENQWRTAGCHSHAVLAGQSASRHYPDIQTDLASEGEAGGACAPPPPVNNLSRLLPATSGFRPGESIANGLDDVAPSNFINDESNRQQKVFDKFPMVEEGREGACGSSAGQGKSDNDSALFLCPVAPAPGFMLDRQGDKGLMQDQGSLEPNVESFSINRLPDFNYKSPFGDPQLGVRVSSESGVSEPVYDENYLYRLCSSECYRTQFAACNSSSGINKGNKDIKKKRIICHPIENGVDSLSVERMMIWSEYEAYLLQVKQIGMSACGQTAVLNLLKAFEVTAEKKDVCSMIQVNLRKEKASVAEYLASRAVAGTTADDLLSGVERLTKGEIRGRFFQMWPVRSIQLLNWLSQWMKQGAVPVATLNLQKGVKQQQQIPDAWHHQMVYGVGPRGVYLTNPLEVVPEETIMEQLMSDSVLLVRRQDVVSRFQPTDSLAPLLHHSDPRWCSMNVLGQVVNVLREHNMPSVPGYRAQVTSHIRIPAVYRAGITLYVRHNTPEWQALRSAPDLPLLSASAES